MKKISIPQDDDSADPLGPHEGGAGSSIGYWSARFDLWLHKGATRDLVRAIVRADAVAIEQAVAAGALTSVHFKNKTLLGLLWEKSPWRKAQTRAEDGFNSLQGGALLRLKSDFEFICNNHKKCIRALVHAQCQMNKGPNKYGDIGCLIWAQNDISMAGVDELILLGAEVNDYVKSPMYTTQSIGVGYSLLHAAIDANNEAFAKRLLKAGAHVHVKHMGHSSAFEHLRALRARTPNFFESVYEDMLRQQP